MNPSERVVLKQLADWSAGLAANRKKAARRPGPPPYYQWTEPNGEKMLVDIHHFDAANRDLKYLADQCAKRSGDESFFETLRAYGLAHSQLAHEKMQRAGHLRAIPQKERNKYRAAYQQQLDAGILKTQSSIRAWVARNFGVTLSRVRTATEGMTKPSS